MKRTLNHLAIESMRLLAAACGMITLLALTTAAVAQQAAPTASKTVASPTASAGVAAKTAARPVAEEESGAPNSANQQGIKVHGHWVLQVKNADGTLGERREFDNSLVTNGQFYSGDQLLAGLLAGDMVASAPAILFANGLPSGSSDLTDFCSNPASPNCWVITTDSTSPFYYSSPFRGLNQNNELGLQVNVTYYPVALVLSGNFTVPTTTSLALVQTWFAGCVAQPSGAFTILNTQHTNADSGHSADIGAKSCNWNSAWILNASTGFPEDLVPFTFTSTTITSGGVATPLPVTAGQIVQVTVTISFS